MPLTLRFQSTGTVPGSAAPVTMRGASLTIGRGDENDLVLPDPDRMISKRHCVIEDHGNRIVVIDISTNGTFLNYSKTPLGNAAVALNAGDVLSLGGYELVVEITDDAASSAPRFEIAPPLEEGRVSHGQAARAPDADMLLGDGRDPADFLDDLLGGPSTTTGPRMLIPEDPLDLAPLVDDGAGRALLSDPQPESGLAASEPDHRSAAHDAFTARTAHAPMIPDDWDLEIEEPPLRPAERPVIAEPLSEPLGSPAAKAALPAESAGPAERPDAGEAAVRAFLQAAGVDQLDIPADMLVATMAQLGAVMQIFVAGIREVLMTRAAIKSEFRISQTRIGAGNNNPLKFSVTAAQAMEAMVRQPSRGYLDPVVAASEALKDVKAHEVAVVSGMEAAFKAILQRLDPKSLEEKIDAGGGFSSLLKGKKARYWEIYEQMYSEIADQAENDFHELFRNEFAKAYDNQLRKL